MPSKEQIFLGKIPKSYSEQTGNDRSKNTPKDVDTEIYSLHYFINLACEGQTVALDMLHAPENMILQTSDIWKQIVKERHRFYTKSMNAFVGYARRQAAKYCIKGSRLAAAKKVLDFIKSVIDKGLYQGFNGMVWDRTIINYWDELPEGEHIDKTQIDKEGNRLYQVCGKNVQETVKLSYLFFIMKKFYESYGERARQAERNLGIDWKAISHALRAAYQTKDILINGTIIYPLVDANFLKAVKAGKYDYKTVVAPLLESLMIEVEMLAEASTLPAKADRKFWDNFIIEKVEEMMK